MKKRNLAISILLVLIVISHTSCKEKNNELHKETKEQLMPEEEIVEQKTEPIAQQEPEVVVKEELDESVVQIIRESFHKEYGEGTRMEEKTVGDWLKITYYDIPSEENSYSSFYIISISIPLTIHPDLKGDLNHDGKDDFIIPVGLAYGNIETSNYHIFINKNDEYKLVYDNGLYIPISSDGESTFFSPILRLNKIENNLIIGELISYAEKDARCCPTISHDIKVKFENNTLHIIEQKERIY